MKVGFFAPLPPARTGVADHAAQLLPALRQIGAVEVAPDRADVNVYHLGNNQLHAEIYRRAIEQPGITVLHDAVLHHFMLGFLSREQYIEEFVYNYGEWSRDLASDLWAGRSRSAADARYFEYPMIRRIAEQSRVVVVHNPAAAAAVLRHHAEARVMEIPLLFAPAVCPDQEEIAAVRQRIGFAGARVICGMFGHLRPSKRLRSVLEACASADLPLIIAGHLPPDLEAGLRPYLADAMVYRTGYRSQRDFWTLAYTVDACINLRYPAAGETSAIAVSMMGAGKAVVLTDSLEVSRYPETACLRVEPGLRERSHLTEVLRWLKQFPLDAREIGTRAAAYMRANHSAERVAELYWDAIRHVA